MPEKLSLFTELLDKLRESKFKIVKASYDLFNENAVGFEIHAVYNDGSSTWRFKFACPSDEMCKVEEDIRMEIVIKKPSVDAFINSAFKIMNTVRDLQKNIHSLAERIKQVLGVDARLDGLKTEIFLNKYYGKTSLNYGLMQIELLPRNIKINIEVSLVSWDETELLTLITQLNNILQRQLP